MAQLGVTIGGDIAPDKGGVGSAPLPAGDYQWEIVKSEVKPTRAGDGVVAEFEAEGCGDDNKGSKLWFRLNVQNPSAQAQAIGQAQLQALKLSCGLEADHPLEDTEELHHRPFWARTAPEDYTNAKGETKTKNELKKILFDGCEERDEEPAAPAPKATPKPSTTAPKANAAAGGGAAKKRPWEK